MSKKTNETTISEVVYAGLLLSFSIVLIMFPIPIYGFISVDFSLSIILISKLYISFRKTLFLAFITPIFSVFSFFPTDIIGILILMVIFIISIFLFSEKDNFLLFTMKTISLLFFISFFNILIFYPIYFNGYKIFLNNFWKVFFIIVFITFISTSLRIVLNLILFVFFIKKIKNNDKIK